MPISKLKLFLLWTMFALQGPSVLGQAPSGAKVQVGHDFWGFKENAPLGTLAFAQTSDGYLWLGTPLGLYRFDGTRFELFHSRFGDQLLSTNVGAVFAPPTGGLWIGYVFGGFSFLKDGRVTNFGREIAPLTGTVFNFAQNANGVLWAATTSGLWKFDYSHWQHIGPGSNVPAGAIREAQFDRDETLWALTGQPVGTAQVTKLVYLRPGSSQFQRAEADPQAVGFTLDADGRVVTSPKGRTIVEDNNGDSADRPQAYPVLRRGSRQIVDRANGVWIIPSEPGVLRLDARGRLADVLDNAPLRNSEIYNADPNPFAKLVDREGNIWFGDQDGVHRYFYSPLIRQELPKNEGAYFAVGVDNQGAVWITAGSENAKLFRVANGQVELRNSKGGFGQFTYRSPDKTVWFGRANGLWRLVDGSLVRVDLPKEMVDKSIYLQAITQDHSGGMWVSFGRHGLYRLADGVWTPYGGHEDLPKTGVLIEFTDSLGRVWFGYTKSQLAVLDGDHVQVFGPNDGIRVGNITAIYGRGSEIWIGGEFGLEQFDHGHFHNIQATDNELLRGISGIVETANGDLWLNGLGGIFHVRCSEIAEALKNSAYQVKGQHFGAREGLPGLPFQVRPLNTAIEGTDGRLWFATGGGVVWIDPARPQTNIPPPPITIQSVSADDKNYQLGSELKFPAHISSVQISYAAISLSDPAAVHYRYKLQETDKNWHETANASPVSYRNLAPGSYHFSVMASDTNGVWSDKVATAEFTILPAFYQTGWFIALCVVSALAFLYMLYVLRVRQLARQFEARMEERVGERTRIARELHDTILQSFQGVLLKFHALTFMLADRPETQEKLEGLVEEASQAITEGREAVKGMRASTVITNDLARSLTQVGERLVAEEDGQNPVAFHVEVEGETRDLHPIIRDEVYRIASESVRNSFHHSSANRIEVRIRYDHRQFRVHICDDGKGIDPMVLQGGGRAAHYGLPGMKERAKLVGGKLEVWSELGSGTETELTIPASVAYAKSHSARWSWFRKKGA